jgi:glucose-1-phosphate cytidylyltransferase
MVQIGDRPILWHILKHYSHFGFRQFIIALGYRGEVIKDYFLRYHFYSRHLTISVSSGHVLPAVAAEEPPEDWTISLVDTGVETLTGGRIRRLREWIGNETFLLTYGDGVSDVPLDAVLAFHREQGRLATLTAVRPPARFGNLTIREGRVTEFTEKPPAGEVWINGGFMVFEPRVFDYVAGDMASLEYEVLHRLAQDGELAAYQHVGFWQCMDTLRDKVLLEQLWQSGAPWRVWGSRTPDPA